MYLESIYFSSFLPSLRFQIHHFFSGLYCDGPLTAMLIEVKLLRHKSDHIMFLPEIFDWHSILFMTKSQLLYMSEAPEWSRLCQQSSLLSQSSLTNTELVKDF